MRTKTPTQRSPKEIVARKLARRSYCTWELKQKLGDEVADIDTVLAEFVQQGYLNDDEWLRSFVQSEEAKGQGPHAIGAKLRNKGVPRDKIEETLALTDPLAALTLAIHKKTRGKPLTRELKQKLIGHLARRGFSWDLIQHAIQQAI